MIKNLFIPVNLVMIIELCEKILVFLEANAIFFIFFVEGQNLYYIVQVNNILESKSYNIFSRPIRLYIYIYIISFDVSTII